MPFPLPSGAPPSAEVRADLSRHLTALITAFREGCQLGWPFLEDEARLEDGDHHG